MTIGYGSKLAANPPPEIQQLFAHCRQGDLGAVECWLDAYQQRASGKGVRSPLKLLFSSSGGKKCAGPLLSGLRDPVTSYTLLHQAALHGHLPIIHLLLAQDPHLAEVRDGRQCLPLHLAAWNGHAEVVKRLLTAQTVNSVNSAMESALHVASMKGYAGVANLLLEGGADATLRNARHETALDIAVRLGNADVCRVLLEQTPELALQVGVLRELVKGSKPSFHF